VHPREFAYRYRQMEMSCHPVRKEQRLIEFPAAQSAGMQRDGEDEIDVQIRRQGIDHELRQRFGQSDFSPILECANSFPERRKVRIKRPSPAEGRAMLQTVLAVVIRRIGDRGSRDEGLAAERAAGSLQGQDQFPTAPTESRDRIALQADSTGKAIDRNDEPQCLAAEAEEAGPGEWKGRQHGGRGSRSRVSSRKKRGSCQGCCPSNGCVIRKDVCKS